MKFKSDAQRRAAFMHMMGANNYFSSRSLSKMVVKPKGPNSVEIDVDGNSTVLDLESSGLNWKSIEKIRDGYRLNETEFSYEEYLRLKNNAEKMNRFSIPDYSESTWQKKIAGVPKYEIDEYYRGIWDELNPQLKDRNILVRYLYDDNKVVKRHLPGNKSYTTIKSKDGLSDIVREHGVELWQETSQKGDLNHGDIAVLDIDNMGSVSERDMKEVAKDVYKRMGKSFGGRPYIINTANGYHVGVKIGKSMPYKTMRNKTDKEVIEPLEDDMGELVSGRYNKAPIFLDKSPMKKHGSSRVIGSLNLPDLVITEKISIEDIDDFKRSKLS